MRIEVAAKLAGLAPEDLAVELLLASEITSRKPPASYMFSASGGPDEHGEHRFTLDLAPELCGKLQLKIRAYPRHPALSHPFELGLMKWL